jgi:hypothetical protein
MDCKRFFPPNTRVLALPNWQNPRLCLPVQCFYQRWTKSSFYPAFSFQARLYRFLLRFKTAAGLGAVRMVPSHSSPLGEFTQDVLPGAIPALILVGTPGPTQKITVQLRNREGEILGYLKYAETEAARKRLWQERRMLSSIPKGIGPEPLKYEALGNGEALLSSLLPGKPLHATLAPTEGLLDFSMSLAVHPPVPMTAHPWVQHVSGRSELAPWLEVLAGKDWSVTIQHGDFVPWNLLRVPGGALGAIDWEYGTLEGFPLLDLAYHVLQTSVLVYHQEPLKAAEYATKYLSGEPRLALSRKEARAVTSLAAYDAYLKFLEDGHPSDGYHQRWRRAIWESSVCAS